MWKRIPLRVTSLGYISSKVGSELFFIAGHSVERISPGVRPVTRLMMRQK